MQMNLPNTGYGVTGDLSSIHCLCVCVSVCCSEQLLVHQLISMLIMYRTIIAGFTTVHRLELAAAHMYCVRTLTHLYLIYYTVYIQVQALAH